MRVAVLYVDPRGPYLRMGVDCYDAERDATTYAGPYPVVAHPPCGPWGVLSHRSQECTRDLGPLAIAQVRKWGGVLEHPIGSRLFDAELCPRPGELPDAWGGFTVNVEQVSWGHPCRKPTRLYVVGVPRIVVERGILRGGEPTHQIFGSRRAGYGHRSDLKAAHAGMRRRTPPRFAAWLIAIAGLVRR